MRDYDALLHRLSPDGTVEDRMQRVADVLWDAFSTTGVSWVGFYRVDPDAPDDQRLVLGPHRDGPACSPIGLHGVCGQAVADRVTRIVEDVADLGDAYVACDPRDRSEIVLPIVDEADEVAAVLDLDSREVAAFDIPDAIGLDRVLAAAGFRVPT